MKIQISLSRCFCAGLSCALGTTFRVARLLSWILLLSIMVGGFNLYAQTHCGSKLSPFVDGPINQRLVHISELHAQGKASISMLVDEIDNQEIAAMTLDDPFSSQSHLNSKVYCGVIAAYLIELILHKSTLILKPLSNYPLLLLGCCEENYIYHSGCIVNVGSKKPIAPESLHQIKVIYEAWWKINNDKGLDEIRNAWVTRGRSPLLGTDFQWK